MVATGGSTVSQKEQCHTKCIFLFGTLEIFKACLYFRFFDFAKKGGNRQSRKTSPSGTQRALQLFAIGHFCHLEKGRISYSLVKKHIIVS